ncbi:hypothetical protein [Rhodococcus xishaensis]|uniref:Uncharacterized protein n=1 Tax=Rhodococcus xishaensis TaxID=2487364 RepID=A0A3S3CTP0_9NOCA|nr:hypothetical protein [Rhodococcus xishaensis]RVW05369.1 hypothetical protein EGT50_01830 [Rhodococcus xishaensis]
MQAGETVAHGTADASSAPRTEEDASDADVDEADVDEADVDEEDHLLASPLAGRIVTAALVTGTAAMVGIVMVSFIEMVVTGALGAATAYLVAHDDGLARRTRHRRSRLLHAPVPPRWRSARQSWRAGDWREDDVAGRHAA